MKKTFYFLAFLLTMAACQKSATVTTPPPPPPPPVQTYTVTASIDATHGFNAYGTISPSSTQVNAGDSLLLRVTAQSGWQAYYALVTKGTGTTLTSMTNNSLVLKNINSDITVAAILSDSLNKQGIDSVKTLLVDRWVLVAEYYKLQNQSVFPWESYKLDTSVAHQYTEYTLDYTWLFKSMYSPNDTLGFGTWALTANAKTLTMFNPGNATPSQSYDLSVTKDSLTLVLHGTDRYDWMFKCTRK